MRILSSRVRRSRRSIRALRNRRRTVRATDSEFKARRGPAGKRSENSASYDPRALSRSLARSTAIFDEGLPEGRSA